MDIRPDPKNHSFNKRSFGRMDIRPKQFNHIQKNNVGANGYSPCCEKSFIQ